MQKSICVDLKWLIAESEHMTRIENPDFSERTPDGWRCRHAQIREDCDNVIWILDPRFVNTMEISSENPDSDKI